MFETEIQLLANELFWLWLVLCGICGACAAGFGGVAAWRLRTRYKLLNELPSNPDSNIVEDILKKTSLWKMSSCESCGKPLGFRCTPILGWFLTRGKCPHCGYAVPFTYTAMEIACALLFIGIGMMFGPGMPALVAMLSVAFLIAAAWTDWETFWIPDNLVIPVLLMGLLVSPIEESHALRIWGMFLPAAFVWVGVKIASFFYGPDAMGDGDILLFAAIGAMVGVDLVPALLIASCGIFVCYAYPMRVFGVSRANDPVRSTGAGEMGSRVLAMGPAIVGAGILCILFPTHLASPLSDVVGLR